MTPSQASAPRHLNEWHEDIGDVLWWLWPIEQSPYVGSPLDIGRTVSFDVTVQIGVDVYEVEPKKIGDTGGWPWADADDETLARIYWTPLPDEDVLDVAIRDDIRGGPDPFAASPSPFQASAQDELVSALGDVGPVLLKAVLECVAAMRAYIAPDGISADEAMARMIAALDNPEISPVILEAEHG